jgi:hypothetical protein
MGTYLQGGKGPSSVFIPVLGPSWAQIWCRADDQVCQLVCSFFIFQACNDPVWITPRLVIHHIDGVPADK